MARRIFLTRGSALITVIMIVSIVVMISSILLWQRGMDIIRLTVLQESSRGAMKAELVNAWAQDFLTKSFWKTQKQKTVEQFPVIFPQTRLDDVTISGQIIDLQARFNLNNLSNPLRIKKFASLVTTLLPDVTSSSAVTLAAQIYRWISPAPSAGDAYYKQLTPPYTVPHQPMVSVSELRLVASITRTQYLALLPYVTTLPPNTPLNVNDADAKTLVTIGNDLPFSIAEQIISYRKQQNGFHSLDELMGLPFLAPYSVDPQEVTLQSRFFLVQSVIKQADHQTIFYRILSREVTPNGLFIRTLWQSRGEL